MNYQNETQFPIAKNWIFVEKYIHVSVLLMYMHEIYTKSSLKGSVSDWLNIFLLTQLNGWCVYSLLYFEYVHMIEENVKWLWLFEIPSTSSFIWSTKGRNPISLSILLFLSLLRNPNSSESKVANLNRFPLPLPLEKLFQKLCSSQPRA